MLGGQTCLLASSGQIVWINESWRRNGSPLPTEMALGSNYLDACRAIDPSLIANIGKLRQSLTQLLAGDAEFFDGEYSTQRGTGQPQLCMIRAQAITLDGRRCALMSHEDVTQARLATSNLHASEERYRQFFEAAPDAVFLLSGSREDMGRILAANSLAASMHGYSREELLAMHIGDLDEPEDAKLVPQRIEKLLRDGSIRFKAMHRRRDGSRFPVEVSARTTTIGGKPCVITFNRDTSEREQYEDTLRDSQVRVALAAKASQVGFWDWNVQDQTVHFSPEWKAQIGYAPDELADTYEEWLSRLHPDDVDQVLAAVDDHIHRRSKDYTTEFRFRHKDGSYRWIYVRGEVAFDQNGNPTRFVGCHIDITAQKEAEAERAVLTQRLSQMQRLEAMGTLAGGIAHDFNNILSIISGNVELALLETDDASVQESLHEIHLASKRAGSLVRQVLSFSRNEPTECRPVLLDTIVADAVQLLRSTTPQRVSIQTEIQAGAPEVFADPEQLHQVLVNLGTNAWHAISGDAGQVTFALTKGKLPEHLHGADVPRRRDDYAIIEIRDNGEGMTEAVRARIFEPFFTTKPVGKGTGLGLSVVHGIISNHGGVIDINSEPGTGTTFRIYLPANTEEEDATRFEKSTPVRASVTVLLIDDEASIRHVLTRGLQRLGFQVTAMEDPQGAIEMLRDDPQRFDAVVTDFDMPGMNGIETAQRIQHLRRDLPIVLCSGFLDAQVSEAAIVAGVARILSKPIMSQDLAAAIQALCQARAQ
jgi:PAS domain S-box-containing protein